MSKPEYTCIFIVEDDSMYSKVVRHSLELRNYQNIYVFQDGESCLENLSLNPEIIFLDYRLGESKMDGMEVLKKIKSHDSNIQVVFLTSNENIEIATNTIKNGAYDYVVKNEASTERIRNVLRRIEFENQIKKENFILKKSRRLIIGAIFLLIIAVLGLVLFHFIK